MYVRYLVNCNCNARMMVIMTHVMCTFRDQTVDSRSVVGRLFQGSNRPHVDGHSPFECFPTGSQPQTSIPKFVVTQLGRNRIRIVRSSVSSEGENRKRSANVENTERETGCMVVVR
jgi:hypothetical protein